MYNINWNDRTILLGLMPIVAAFIAVAVTRYGYPHLALGLSRSGQYWLLRTGPIVNLVLPPLTGLGIVALLPRSRRWPVAALTMAITLFIICVDALHEYLRLAPYAQSHAMSADELLTYVDPAIVIGAILALLIGALAVRHAIHVPNHVKRVRHGHHGDADWMTITQARKLLPEHGSVVIGEAYRVDRDIVAGTDFDPANRGTWGKGGRAPLLCYRYGNDSGHMLFFAGSGGYKTSSSVIPTALTYDGPIVCLDPSMEIAPMVTRARRKQNPNRRIYVLDPNDRSTGFNALDFIETSNRKQEDINAVAHMLRTESARVESSTGSYFQDQAHNLLTGLLSHILLSPAYKGPKTLLALRNIVSKPEETFLEMLRSIIANESEPQYVRQTLGVFANMTEQTFSGVYSTASRDTQWLSFDGYADLVCGNSFRSSDIASGDVDVFINIRADTLKSFPGIGRVILGSFINAMIQADGRHSARVLFIVDEANRLGYMSLLETARDMGRKYGVSVMMFYQATGQLESHFGREGASSWFESAAITSYAVVRHSETAARISRLCGTFTVETSSHSRQKGLFAKNPNSHTQNVSHQKRPLILEHEIIQEMRQDEQIVFMQGQRPLRCGRAIYFRRPDMVERTEVNRFAPRNQ